MVLIADWEVYIFYQGRNALKEKTRHELLEHLSELLRRQE